jgi:hypothetical protein
MTLKALPKRDFENTFFSTIRVLVCLRFASQYLFGASRLKMLLLPMLCGREGASLSMKKEARSGYRRLRFAFLNSMAGLRVI